MSLLRCNKEACEEGDVVFAPFDPYVETQQGSLTQREYLTGQALTDYIAKNTSASFNISVDAANKIRGMHTQEYGFSTGGQHLISDKAMKFEDAQKLVSCFNSKASTIYQDMFMGQQKKGVFAGQFNYIERIYIKK